MRECEAVFMEMMTRLEWKRSIPFFIRKHLYLRHLRFWNDYLTRHAINFYLSAWIPHEIPDIVIYHLCKVHGVPVLYFEDTAMVRDTSFAERDIRDSAIQIRPRYEELLREFTDVRDPAHILLEKRFDDRFWALARPEGERPPAKVTRLSRWKLFREMIVRAPLAAFRIIAHYGTLSGVQKVLLAWGRRRVIRACAAFYDAHAITPDLTVPFVYFPLHYQPEASTAPMGGCFVDQILVAQLLAQHLPHGVLLYVKEHIWTSGWLKRDIAFYEDLLAIPNVRLVARSSDTFLLREHCKALATVTGTAGFEAIFRGKPVFLFGSRFYQYARGVYPIRTRQDCADAVRAVFQEGRIPSPMESRLFLKAVEETCVPGTLNPWHYDVTQLPFDAHVENHARAILQEVATVFH
ncbi:MAG: hypothetical protein PHI23_04520 [Candidatus Peribacteraceae bacterium]|nr:hypothetical protein [Candidatus Peribacteraceae bacterium]